MSWRAYCNKLERDCPKELSLWILSLTIHFYAYYLAGVHPKKLMDTIVALAANEALTIEQRHETLRNLFPK